jgi:hypothetical protein
MSAIIFPIDISYTMDYLGKRKAGIGVMPHRYGHFSMVQMLSPEGGAQVTLLPFFDYSLARQPRRTIHVRKSNRPNFPHQMVCHRRYKFPEHNLFHLAVYQTQCTLASSKLKRTTLVTPTLKILPYFVFNQCSEGRKASEPELWQ